MQNQETHTLCVVFHLSFRRVSLCVSRALIMKAAPDAGHEVTRPFWLKPVWQGVFLDTQSGREITMRGWQSLRDLGYDSVTLDYSFCLWILAGDRGRHDFKNSNQMSAWAISTWPEVKTVSWSQSLKFLFFVCTLEMCLQQRAIKKCNRWKSSQHHKSWRWQELLERTYTSKPWSA